jgi:hypothetical protein
MQGGAAGAELRFRFFSPLRIAKQGQQKGHSGPDSTEGTFRARFAYLNPKISEFCQSGSVVPSQPAPLLRNMGRQGPLSLVLLEAVMCR